MWVPKGKQIKGWERSEKLRYLPTLLDRALSEANLRMCYLWVKQRTETWEWLRMETTLAKTLKWSPSDLAKDEGDVGSMWRGAVQEETEAGGQGAGDEGAEPCRVAWEEFGYYSEHKGNLLWCVLPLKKGLIREQQESRQNSWEESNSPRKTWWDLDPGDGSSLVKTWTY